MCRTFLPLFVFPGVCLSLVPFIATLTGLLRGLVFLACLLTVMFFYLNWQVAHGVLFTVDRLISFGYNYDPACFLWFW